MGDILFLLEFPSVHRPFCYKSCITFELLKRVKDKLAKLLTALRRCIERHVTTSFVQSQGHNYRKMYNTCITILLSNPYILYCLDDFEKLATKVNHIGMI